MNIANRLLIAFIGMLSASIAGASSNESPSRPVTWTLTNSVYSEYLARPGFVLYDKNTPVWQSELVARGKSIYAGVWSSVGLEPSPTMRPRKEFQLYLGLNKPYKWITLDGNIRYDVFKDLSLSRDDLLMLDGRMEFTRVPVVKPYIAVRHFRCLGLAKPDSGWFVWFGFRRMQDLGIKTKAGQVRAAFDASVAYTEGALSRDPGWVYGRLLSQIMIPWNERLMIVPQLMIQTPFDKQGIGRIPYTDGRTHFVSGLNITYKF
jgi:hypothetical protein